MTDTATRIALADITIADVLPASICSGRCGICHDADAETIEIVVGDRVVGTETLTIEGTPACADCYSDAADAIEIDGFELDPTDALRDYLYEREDAA